MQSLLTTATTDGDGTIVSWNGGLAVIGLSGTMDGATVTLYIDIGGGYITNTDLAMTTTGLYKIYSIPAGALIKLTVSSADTSTSVSAGIKRI